MYKYSTQYIDQEDIDSIIAVLRSDGLTQGPVIEEFEQALRKELIADYASAVSSGTAALHLAGLSLGWKQGDLVITTPLTFLSSANCIVYTGATPDFVDIDPITYTINPNMVEEKVKRYWQKGEKVKAVVAVDYAGHPCDWAALRTIADRYDLQLVNDNCHALGAKYRGDKGYAVKYAEVSTLSFHPVKHITTGEGGVTLTNDAKTDEKVRLLRTHGVTRDPEVMGAIDGPWYYEMIDLGYNYRITDIQCALGISQLRKLDMFVMRRREIAKLYDEAFTDDPFSIIPTVSEEVEHAYHLYPLQVKFDEVSLSMPELFEKMSKKGIQLQVHYIPVHLQPYYRKNYGFKKGDFPIAEEFYTREISLPIYYSLSNDDVRFIVDSLKASIN